MLNFFKNFGKGILYVLVLPFLLVILAAYFVVSLIIFIVLGIKGIILFFMGSNLFADLPEDVMAKKALAINNPSDEDEDEESNNENSTNQNSASPSGYNLYPEGYTFNTYEAAFGSKPKPKEENSEPNDIVATEEEEAEVSNDEIKVEVEPQNEEIETSDEDPIEQYIPLSSNTNTNKINPKHDTNDEDTSSGIDISSWEEGDDDE